MKTRITTQNCNDQVEEIFQQNIAQDPGINTTIAYQAANWETLLKYIEQEKIVKTKPVIALIIDHLETNPIDLPNPIIIDMDMGKSIIATAQVSVIYLKLHRMGAISWDETVENIIKKGISDNDPRLTKEYEENYITFLNAQKYNNNDSNYLAQQITNWYKLFPMNFKFTNIDTMRYLKKYWKNAFHDIHELGTISK